MASIQYKLVGTLFRVLRVNKMLDKEGPEFEKLLETYRIKQKKPLAVPYKRMDDFDIITKTVEGTTVYVVRKKGAMPQKTGKLINEILILWTTVRANHGLQCLQEKDHQNVKNRLAVVK